MTIVKTREFSVNLIDRARNGASFSEAFSSPAFLAFSSQEQSWIKALCMTTCRYYFALESLLKSRLKKPLKEKDHFIETILFTALAELFLMNTKEYACVSQYVMITKKHSVWAKDLVNAVLRSILRDHQRRPIDLQFFSRFPVWWKVRVEQDWRNESSLILNEDKDSPPFTLRINATKTSRNEYESLLKERGFSVSSFDTPINDVNEMAITVTPAVPAHELPRFREGFLSVQDVSAQYAAFLLNPKKNSRVLDACAAPGGKTTHLLERFPEIELFSIDVDDKRVQKIKENIARLQLHSHPIHLIVNDAALTSKWWDSIPFDHILLDVPCSSTGVVRRHPDIKLLRKPEDIPQFAKIQLNLLKAVWKTLAQNGELLYSTCSIFKEENDGVIHAFLAQEPKACIIPLPQIGKSTPYGQQLLPGVHHGDGFYYAKLKKLP